MNNYWSKRKKGFSTKRYTMTLWANENDIKDFARSVAALQALSKSGVIAKEIRTITIENQTLS